MRRTIPLILTATLLFAACSSDDDNASDTSSSETSDTPVDTSATDTGSATPRTNPEKPEVEIPDEIPTELVVTVIEEGTGPAAAAGDTVVIDYVGVRTSDGVEFDSSFNERQPGVAPSAFTFVLGEQQVIAGWDEGLVGAQAGARIQLDIPSDLAYGEEPRSEVIGANEALTFLLDVRAVVPPGEEPTDMGVDPSAGATEITTFDLREGDGATIELGQTALVRFVIFRGDNGVALQNNWADPLQPIPVTEDLFPPLLEGLQGMQVGGQRAIVFPPAYPDFGFGPEGNPQGGLPAETDVVMVVDLVGVYGQPEG
jgi:peptidylprolyl isomerase